MSHGFGMTGTPHEPELYMEKVMFATDELTGLIGAAALMRPSRSVSDLETPSVMKKFKDKKFAAGCSREVISKGAEILGWTLDELLNETLQAMKEVEKSANSD
jgi:predicted hydrolase (HD superfamily)